MIDATTPLGMARLICLLATGSDCWCVISSSLARRYYADALAQL